ncbi:PBP1 [[Candida] subhashii]|uniref:PBP1 n=1 Tax=[Candida] subhashii TaxID=561895 RepID=A0A8J5QG98_9ASCO|nr:PBP1 [[Candida] subhashii]KAG7661569.1 PBP1 [[Candida] subhashii]
MKGQINRTINPKNGGGGHRRSNSRYNGSPNEDSTTSTSPTTGGNNKGNDRLLYLLSKSTGKKCIATITDGSRYQGLLVASDLSANGSAPLSIVLYKPQLISKPLINEKNNLDDDNELPENLIIQAKNLIDLEVNDINLNEPIIDSAATVAGAVTTNGKEPVKEGVVVAPVKTTTPTPATSTTTSPPVAKAVTPTPIEQQPAEPKKVTLKEEPKKVTLKEEPKFKTDSDISGKFAIKERELQRWVPDEDIAHHPALTLESGSTGGAWDQFKVNEERFGVESTYDEHLYTTRIDTSAPDYHERVARADRIAREIETQATSDRHILEERGIIVDDSGIDEEDKYSGVDRRGDELMAALRNATLSQESLTSPTRGDVPKSSPGKYVIPRHRAAQYHNDPAIVSSSAVKAVASTPPQQTQASPAPVSTSVPAPAPVKEQAVPVPVPTIPAKPQVSQSVQATASSTSLSSPKPEVKPVVLPKKQPDSIPPKPQIPAGQHNESFRLNAQSEINSLREFSANFKIPHKMPQDLLPILAKDKLKQDEILKKQREQQQQKAKKEAEIAAAAAQKKKDSTASVAASASTTTVAAAPPSIPATPVVAGTSAAATPTTGTSKTFKLNPKAAVFTPSTKHAQLTSPKQPKVNYHRSPSNVSPRMAHSRPYSSNGSISSQGSTKRHHQISAADFFGGVDKIPSKESQEKKINAFKFGFSLFVTTRNKHDFEKDGPVVYYERTFQTPPTWDSTIDETHDKLFPMLSPSPTNTMKPIPGMMIPTASPFIPNPMMAAAAGGPGGAPIATGYHPHHHQQHPSANPNKFPMSPQQQQAAAAAAAMAMQFQQQQQQFHAAMFQYQQQQQHHPQQHQFVSPPGAGQPPMGMYPAMGDPGAFLPPGAVSGAGFIPGMPVAFGSGVSSPVNGNIMMAGATPPYSSASGQGGQGGQGQHGGYGGGHHGRRYGSHSKRGGGGGGQHN